MPVYKGRARVSGRAEASTLYQLSFIKDVHCILARGFQQLAGTSLAGCDEPAMTGALVKVTRNFLESDECPPRWRRAYHVNDEVPINDQLLPKGMSRPRIDIEFIRIGSRQRPAFHFEAKRLRGTGSLSEYIGEDGLGCFLTGKYSRQQGHAGMLGYVESDAPQEWAHRLRGALREHDSILLEGDFWKQEFLPDLEHCYSTRHTRPDVGQAIGIYHTLLDLRAMM